MITGPVGFGRGGVSHLSARHAAPVSDRKSAAIPLGISYGRDHGADAVFY